MRDGPDAPVAEMQTKKLFYLADSTDGRKENKQRHDNTVN